MIKAILQGAIVIGLFCFAGYGIHYGLKKVGFMGKIKKSFRPKPTEEIYDEVGKKFSKENFNDFAQEISKYKLPKQRQYIDAYLDLKNKKLKGGKEKHGRERQSKESFREGKKAKTPRTKKRRTKKAKTSRNKK